MRKLISLGLFALMFSIFSSQVFAGNVDECKNLKDKTHVDYAPTLYGLCVAWHNADENAKDRIAENYRRKSGGDEVPGSSQDCPCWAGISLDDVVNGLNGVACTFDNSENLNGYDSVFFVGANFVSLAAGNIPDFPVELPGCIKVDLSADPTSIWMSVSAEENVACRMDIYELIIDPNFPIDCGQDDD